MLQQHHDREMFTIQSYSRKRTKSLDDFMVWSCSCSSFPYFIGNLHQLKEKKPHQTFARWAEVYGPIYSIRTGAFCGGCQFRRSCQGGKFEYVFCTLYIVVTDMFVSYNYTIFFVHLGESVKADLFSDVTMITALKILNFLSFLMIHIFQDHKWLPLLLGKKVILLPTIIKHKNNV